MELVSEKKVKKNFSRSSSSNGLNVSKCDRQTLRIKVIDGYNQNIRRDIKIKRNTNLKVSMIWSVFELVYLT